MTPLVILSAVEGPLVVATDWGAAGVPALAGLIGTIAVATMFYRRMLRRDPPALAVQGALAALALAAAWCVPVLFSSDVYAYAAYGEMARIGLNPYLHAPPGTADALVHTARSQWVTAFPICIYGPAFVAFSRLVVTVLAPWGALAQLDGFRFAASFALLLCIPLAYGAFSGDRVTRLRAAATVGLNPVALWCCAEGHNDAIALAAVFAGFVLVRGRLVGTGAALVALSATIKLPGLAAAIALGVSDRRARFGALAGIAVAIFLSLPLITGVTTQLSPHGTYAPQASLQAVVGPFGPIVAFAAAVAVCALLATRGVALLRAATQEGWIWLGLAGWVLIPNPYPWYGLWLVALAGFAPQSRAGAVAIALSLSSLLRYAPDAVGTPPPLLAAALGTLACLPLVALRPFDCAQGDSRV